MSALDTQVGGGHYKNLKIQPIEYIHANNIPFAEGCVIKYVSRWRDKNGIVDLEKARHFLDLLIELERKNMPYVPVTKDPYIPVSSEAQGYSSDQQNTTNMLNSMLERKSYGGLV